jgi:ribonuclease HI
MLTAYCDGACRISNPGLCSCAWVLYGMPGGEVSQAQYLGPEFHTNNYAEYQGLILLLEHLYTHSMRNVIIHCDSELVVNQVNDVWDLNSQDLLPLWQRAYGLLVQGCHVLKHVKGHEGNKGNERADALCNEMLDINMEDYNATKTLA